MSASDNEWTEIERAALRALPLDEHVPAALADATVVELQTRGLLQRRPRMQWQAMSLAAAAALVLFFAGAAIGQARGTRIGHQLALDAMTAVPQDNAVEIARIVQRTGSAYVEALAVLANLQNGDAASAAQAREAALTITEAVLHEVTTFTADTSARTRLVQTLQRPAAARSVWY